MKQINLASIRILAGATLAAAGALASLAANAARPPESIVVGSGNTDGFTLAGYVEAGPNGMGSGVLTVIGHRDTPSDGIPPDQEIASVSCTYKKFDDVVISGNIAQFRSVGSCVVMREDGVRYTSLSDNSFTIVDNGEPGAANDTVDVNFSGPSGIAVPGSALIDGNFVVTP